MSGRNLCDQHGSNPDLHYKPGKDFPCSQCADIAMRVLLDAASYARFRKDEPLPESLSDEKVAEAMQTVWHFTFGFPMRKGDKAGMYMPKTVKPKCVESPL